MEYRVNLALPAELNRFEEAGLNIAKCFNCGTCTAMCSLTEGERSFPRRMIRYAQLGLEERLLESAEPWLCYYCGECSKTCPREAQPGELMMALRRWLTTKYDFTGLSRRLYLSHAWEAGLLAGVALLVLALFLLPGWLGVPFGFAAITPEAAEHVRLDLFAPRHVIHIADWVLAAFLLVFLGVNAIRMIYYVRRGHRDRQTRLSDWLGQAHQLIVHGVTQKHWRGCEKEERRRWLFHVLLVSGYATMFLLVVVFLGSFQRDDADFHWTALFGYYATATLMGVTLAFMRDRVKKRAEISKYSHVTDWMFLVLLFLTSLSGILLHLARLLDLPWPTYVLYVVHLMIAVPMLVVEVPFGKWLHLVFRPVSEYLTAVAHASESRGVQKATVRVVPATQRP